MKLTFANKIAFFAVIFASQAAHALDVVFLTQQGPPPKSRVLRSWTPEQIAKFAGSKKSISAQKFIMEESAVPFLDLNDLADVDLITLYGEKQEVRVPRFMIWRGHLQLDWNPSTKTMNAHADLKKLVPNRLLVPEEIFNVRNIHKIELTQHTWIYPGTKLTIRTNPAASRGEKLFTQSCLACHSLPEAKPIAPSQLTFEMLKNFEKVHAKYPILKLDGRATRGLEAYRDALAKEKAVVK